MGFWSGIKKVIQAPRKIVATGLEKLGNALARSDFSPVYQAGWALQDLGEKITPKCYREEHSTVTAEIDVAGDCKRYYAEAREKLVPELNAQCNAGKERINSTKREIQMLVPTEVFEQVKAQIPNDLYEDTRKESLDKLGSRISTSQNEFVGYLGIQATNMRKEKCTEYVRKTLEDVGEMAYHQIQERTTEVIRQMIGVIESYMENQKKLLEEKKQDLQNLESQQDQQDYIRNQLNKEIVDIAYLSCILSTRNLK